VPYTVWGAFKEFKGETVDLSPEVTASARSSRNYLFEQLRRLAEKDSSFPRLLNEFMPFGSFARRTKIRPLDDIDVMPLLNGRGTTSVHMSSSDPYTYWLRIDDSSAPLDAFRDDYGYVSSIKVLNKIKSSLASVSNYRRAEIKRNLQAVTLELYSYDWVFDVVPGVPINDGLGGRAYFLIPNGKGDWTRTDPRIDQTNVTRLNSHHGGQFLPTVRLLKYWNKRTIKPVLRPYYFEILALKVFDYAPKIEDFPSAVKYFFDHCPTYLWMSCPDPKGLGPDLDADVAYETKQKVFQAMNDASWLAGRAIDHEARSEHKEAIELWGRVFSRAFPSYGG
jgi:hypothetical protein